MKFILVMTWKQSEKVFETYLNFLAEIDTLLIVAGVEGIRDVDENWIHGCRFCFYY